MRQKARRRASMETTRLYLPGQRFGGGNDELALEQAIKITSGVPSHPEGYTHRAHGRSAARPAASGSDGPALRVEGQVTWEETIFHATAVSLRHAGTPHEQQIGNEAQPLTCSMGWCVGLPPPTPMGIVRQYPDKGPLMSGGMAASPT